MRVEIPSRPFRPAAWLPGPHAQTVWATLGRRVRTPGLRRARVRTPDGDFLNVHTVAGLRGAPVLLLIHGLEGSVRSHYVQALLGDAQAAGWSALAMELRGVGPVMNRARRLYHSGASDDVEAVVSALARRHPDVPLFAAGFSLGANMLGKYLGEVGGATPLAGAALVSPPFDLERCAPCADTALGGIYRRQFLAGLRARALRKARQFPGLLDEEAVRACRTLTQFDDCVTAPLHGFADAADYYRRCGCGQFLPGIRVRTLVIAAQDDPLVPADSIPRAVLKRSPWLVPLLPRHGGHLGFVEGPPWRPRYWAEEQVMTFFRALA